MAQKSKKIAKDKAKPKASKGNPITRVWRETVGELRKVTWPTPQEAWRLTRIVVIVMVFMAALLGIFDQIFTRLIGLLYS